VSPVRRRDADHRLHHRTASARGPPLWEMQDAERDEFDLQAQPVPDYEFDQRIAW
jgi:hypothetical protein